MASRSFLGRAVVVERCLRGGGVCQTLLAANDKGGDPVVLMNARDGGTKPTPPKRRSGRFAGENSALTSSPRPRAAREPASPSLGHIGGKMIDLLSKPVFLAVSWFILGSHARTSASKQMI
jgi:hypothetical protein